MKFSFRKVSILLPVGVSGAFHSCHVEVERFLPDISARESRHTSVTDLCAGLAFPI